METQFKLGQMVKDKYTGLEGRIRVASIYLTGCTRYGVQPKALDENSAPVDWVYFDEMELEAIIEEGQEPSSTGGPQPVPKRQANPK